MPYTCAVIVKYSSSTDIVLKEYTAKRTLNTQYRYWIYMEHNGKYNININL